MYAGLDHHVYTPAVIGGRSLTTPTKFCFAMKVKKFSLSFFPSPAAPYVSIQRALHVLQNYCHVLIYTETMQCLYIQ